MTKPTKCLCAQRRLRSAGASSQSHQSLCCPHEESLGPYLPTERTVKTLIWLGTCPGWSESSLGTPSLCWFCHVAAHLFSENLPFWSCWHHWHYDKKKTENKNFGSWIILRSILWWQIRHLLCTFCQRLNTQIFDHSRQQTVVVLNISMLKFVILVSCTAGKINTIILLDYLCYILHLLNLTSIWAATWQNQQSDSAPSKDSDQTGRIWSESSLCA